MDEVKPVVKEGGEMEKIRERFLLEFEALEKNIRHLDKNFSPTILTLTERSAIQLARKGLQKKELDLSQAGQGELNRILDVAAHKIDTYEAEAETVSPKSTDDERVIADKVARLNAGNIEFVSTSALVNIAGENRFPRSKLGTKLFYKALGKKWGKVLVNDGIGKVAVEELNRRLQLVEKEEIGSFNIDQVGSKVFELSFGGDTVRVAEKGAQFIAEGEKEPFQTMEGALRKSWIKIATKKQNKSTAQDEALSGEAVTDAHSSSTSETTPPTRAESASGHAEAAPMSHGATTDLSDAPIDGSSRREREEKALNLMIGHAFQGLSGMSGIPTNRVDIPKAKQFFKDQTDKGKGFAGISKFTWRKVFTGLLVAGASVTALALTGGLAGSLFGIGSWLPSLSTYVGSPWFAKALIGGSAAMTAGVVRNWWNNRWARANSNSGLDYNQLVDAFGRIQKGRKYYSAYESERGGSERAGRYLQSMLPSHLLARVDDWRWYNKLGARMPQIATAALAGFAGNLGVGAAYHGWDKVNPLNWFNGSGGGKATAGAAAAAVAPTGPKSTVLPPASPKIPVPPHAGPGTRCVYLYDVFRGPQGGGGGAVIDAAVSRSGGGGSRTAEEILANAPSTRPRSGIDIDAWWSGNRSRVVGNFHLSETSCREGTVASIKEVLSNYGIDRGNKSTIVTLLDGYLDSKNNGSRLLLSGEDSPSRLLSRMSDGAATNANSINVGLKMEKFLGDPDVQADFLRRLQQRDPAEYSRLFNNGRGPLARLLREAAIFNGR